MWSIKCQWRTTHQTAHYMWGQKVEAVKTDWNEPIIIAISRPWALVKKKQCCEAREWREGSAESSPDSLVSNFTFFLRSMWQLGRHRSGEKWKTGWKTRRRNERKHFKNIFLWAKKRALYEENKVSEFFFSLAVRAEEKHFRWAFVERMSAHGVVQTSSRRERGRRGRR